MDLRFYSANERHGLEDAKLPGSFRSGNRQDPYAEGGDRDAER